ncbi:MAG: hypothetical protein ACSHXB_20555 [Sulfitobacter sp.]
MSKPDQLNEDQQQRIKATLARIRGGLAALKLGPSSEPAHTYKPESFDAKHS